MTGLSPGLGDALTQHIELRYTPANKHMVPLRLMPSGIMETTRVLKPTH